jgi:pimeloyl-ACP methyl ester carboxylesterase
MTLRGPAGRLLQAWALAAVLILLAAPVALRAWAGWTGLCFLVEFLTDGQRPWLSRGTPPPVVEPLARAGATAGPPPDLWHPGGRKLGPWPGLVLVHGLTPEGKRDPRLAWTADRLARAGFAVVVPELPELRAQRLRPDDALVVRDTLERLARHPTVRPGPVAVIAVSVGLAPVALALDEPRLAERVRLLVALGGYAEARELVRYFTTGAYAFGGIAGRGVVDPALAGPFLARNLELVPDARDRAAVADALQGRPASPDAGPGARAVLALLRNREPARVDALLDALPSQTRDLLTTLSPARHLGRAPSRLLLVHGKDDPAIPFTESLRLAAAAPGRSRLVLVGLIGHVEGQAPAWTRVVDLARLWSVCYELLAG